MSKHNKVITFTFRKSRDVHEKKQMLVPTKRVSLDLLLNFFPQTPTCIYMVHAKTGEKHVIATFVLVLFDYSTYNY